MGVQAPSAILEDKRVPVAGGTHCICNQTGGRRRGICNFRFSLKRKKDGSCWNITFICYKLRNTSTKDDQLESSLTIETM
jgi:hypothetical protein